MDELASKLNDLLGSADGMEKIRNLAAMLGSQSQPAEREEPPGPAPPQEQASIAPPEGDRDLMRMMMKMAPLLARFRQEDDSTRLLRCLRPFLSEAKQKKLDEAVKLMQFMRVIPYLKDSGLF